MRPDALCTLEAAKLALGLPPSSTGEDTRLTLLIEAATDVIQRACGRKFVRRNYNDGDIADPVSYHDTTQVPDEERFYIDGAGQTVIVLPNYPIVDDDGLIFESLASRASAGDTWDTLVKNEDYVVDRRRGILKINGGKLVHGVKNYRVTYEAGYIEGGQAPWVPADLQELCAQLVREGSEDRSQVTSETIGSWSRSYDISKKNPFLEAAKIKYSSDANFL